ncbi:MAG: Ku protein [Acidobacteriaceae bacterium]
MRAIWTGALGFGLVNIPIRLYSATSGTGLDFDMLHKKDLSPIRYARVCRSDGHEIPYDEIVKGYEYRKGDYVVLTDEDFKKANARKTQTVDIVDFSDEDKIDSIYYEKPYYLEPDKGAERAYMLLREALKRSKKVGIAKYVLRNKEHLGVIKPMKNAIVLNQLRFKDEIRPPEGLNLPEIKEAKGKEIDMALALIDQLTEPFDPEVYKDTYKQELTKVIEAKVKGKPVEQKDSEPEPTEVRDLMAALKQSLEKERARARS